MGISPLLALVAWMPLAPTGLSADVTDRDKGLISRVESKTPWCGGTARFNFTLSNVGSQRLWITLEDPAEENIEPLHYSYSHDLQGEVVGGVACGCCRARWLMGSRSVWVMAIGQGDWARARA